MSKLHELMMSRSDSHSRSAAGGGGGGGGGSGGEFDAGLISPGFYVGSLRAASGIVTLYHYHETYLQSR